MELEPWLYAGGVGCFVWDEACMWNREREVLNFPLGDDTALLFLPPRWVGDPARVDVLVQCKWKELQLVTAALACITMFRPVAIGLEWGICLETVFLSSIILTTRFGQRCVRSLLQEAEAHSTAVSVLCSSTPFHSLLSVRVAFSLLEEMQAQGL